MMRHLYLIGYRGSGKTSVGRVLSELLHRPAIDSDDWIEQHAGLSIREIFEVEGEIGFRNREAEAIDSISKLELPHIVSLGGGAILRPSNVVVLRHTGWIVWLKASADLLHARIHADSSTRERRPPLTTLSGLEEIQSILKIRTPIYESVANYSVDTDLRDTRDIAGEILTKYQSQPAYSSASNAPCDTKDTL